MSVCVLIVRVGVVSLLLLQVGSHNDSCVYHQTGSISFSCTVHILLMKSTLIAIKHSKNSLLRFDFFGPATDDIGNISQFVK